MRAFVACGWFGIQTWIGGHAIYKILAVFWPAVASGSADNFLGITGAEFSCFLFFWLINMAVVFKGIDSIRLLLNFKAPVLIVLGLLLLAWAYRNAGGFGPILSQPSAFDPGQPKAGQFWTFFFPALTGMIGFWATLSLNVPDFSRYAVSQRDQAWGQALGLPLTMALYSFIGVAVTSATTIIYGETIWDPVDVLTRFNNPFVLVIAMFALCIATLATNIAANVVSPANDFANLAPKRISFRVGGLITGLVGILIMPWKLVADPSGYIFTWLIGYSALLGPIGGIMIADYFVWRKTKLSLPALYSGTGEYRYSKGFSWVAIIALLAGALPSLPGFLATVGLIDGTRVSPFLLNVYNYAWFVGFGIAFASYLSLRKIAPHS
jgi:NCS1 family nucleobase:cation symporter-1